MTKHLIASAVFCLFSSVVFAQTPGPSLPVYPGPGAVPAGGSGPGAGMLATGANATSVAFGNLVTAATAASARASLGLDIGNSPTFSGETITLSGANQYLIQGTTSTNGAASISPTTTSNVTSSIVNTSLSGTSSPAGATLTNLRHINITANANASSAAITNFQGINLTNTLGSTFAGTVTNSVGFNVNTPTFTGGSTQTSFPSFVGYQLGGVANGNGITTGTVSNFGLFIGAMTAAAGSGGTIANTAVNIAMPSSSAAGNTDIGIKITGNGGAASTKFAIQSTSTAASSFAGTMAATGYLTGATAGLASKTCTINAANVTTGITITITGGLVTGTTTC